MDKLKFNIPEIEIKIKLNSTSVSSVEWTQRIEKTIKRLIKELVHDKFKLIARITQENAFAISISAVPDLEIKCYQFTVDIGLFRMLYDGLYVILSNNNVFGGLGTSYSQFDIATLEVPDWNSLDLAMANSNDVLFDEDRVELHEFLYELCLSFIIQHEIRHIANGHIDYLREKSYPLFYEHSKNGLDPLDSQTLEMDVDSCVFAGILDGLLKYSTHKNRMPEILQNERGIFMSALFCIQFLFYCMPSKKVSSISQIETNSHPNAYLRYFFCFTTGLSYLQDNYPEYVEIFGNLHKDNFWQFIDNIPEKDIDKMEKIRQDYEWSISEEGFEYANRIWNNWDKWIPILQPFAYLELAPS